MRSLKLFSGVIAKDSDNGVIITDNGIVIGEKASYAESIIVDYYNKSLLYGDELNKTFHKSWDVIKNSSRLSLLIEQITHYVSTYGSDFKDEIYFPDELLELPDLKVTLKFIKGYSKEEFINMSLDMLNSGIALKQETIMELIEFLVYDLNYKFESLENVKNKEAKIILSDKYEIYPSNPVDVLRYAVYKATDESLLIKSKSTIDAIKGSKYNPKSLFNSVGLENMATIFNRFKPLFLAFKSKCPKIINRISKLSKTNHVALIENPLNNVTNKLFNSKQVHWLDNATPYALFKALNATYSRSFGQEHFSYKIRNGKSFVKKSNVNKQLNFSNFTFLISYLKKRYNFKDKIFLMSEGVNYGLPTSEKLFIDNIPMGTVFSGKNMVDGIYWENSGGARDIDVSGINIAGKVGWNSAYKQKGGLYYSGDITNAPDGAIEYLYVKNGFSGATLLKSNVYSGSSNSKCKLVVGKGSKTNIDFMINTNKVMFQGDSETTKKETIWGIFLSDGEKQKFVLAKAGGRSLNVSSNKDNISLKAYFEQYTNQINFNELLTELGAKIIYDDKENFDFDFRVKSINKNSFVNLFV